MRQFTETFKEEDGMLSILVTGERVIEEGTFSHNSGVTGGSDWVVDGE